MLLSDFPVLFKAEPWSYLKTMDWFSRDEAHISIYLERLGLDMLV